MPPRKSYGTPKKNNKEIEAGNTIGSLLVRVLTHPFQIFVKNEEQVRLVAQLPGLEDVREVGGVQN